MEYYLDTIVSIAINLFCVAGLFKLLLLIMQ